MILNHFITIKALLEGLQEAGQTGMLRLPLRDVLMEEEELPGFSVLRKAISAYEEEQGIAEAQGKSRMPFYRQHQRRLIGPELVPFIASFYETDSAWNDGDVPSVMLSFDYHRLAAHCLSENAFLFRCKYDEAQSVESLKQSLAQEYHKVFFDEENTGFAPDSRFVSLLYNAALEIRPAQEQERKEWRLALFKTPEEADYRWDGQTIRTSAAWDVPLSCLERLTLKPDYRLMPELYTALIGLMKQQGLAPERLLTGLVEEE